MRIIYEKVSLFCSKQNIEISNIKDKFIAQRQSRLGRKKLPICITFVLGYLKLWLI